MNIEQLKSIYQNQLNEVLMPFWLKATDSINGGVFTCFNNEGNQLISKDKYTWSQGRWLWMLSRLAAGSQKGMSFGDDKQLTRLAEETAEFLQQYALLENKHCAYLLTKDGKPIEAFDGSGLDASFYADCFVVLGFAEFAKLTKREDMAEWAYSLYNTIRIRLTEEVIKCEPYPIPKGYRAHSVSMIMLHVSHVLVNCLAEFQHSAVPKLWQDVREDLRMIMEFFYDSTTDTIIEYVPADRKEYNTRLVRHINPGHAIECMWFVMDVAEQLGLNGYMERACKVIKKSFDLGWDTTYGGLLRFVDPEGEEPQGVRGNSRIEQLIEDTWDMKLWWPQTEALYALLRAYDYTGDEQYYKRFEMMHQYVLSTFPNPNHEVGEWIQIRNRLGQPIQKLVALPVKDPYHIIRNVLLIIELLHSKR